jgi:hypothetical protein
VQKHTHDPINGFVEIDGNLGWVFSDHLRPIRQLPAADKLSLAQLFMDTPYLYAGRSAFGIDCSGLIQLVLQAHHIACPRDTDQQESHFRNLGYCITSEPQSGDLVYFKGHVGIMNDHQTTLSATARAMKVVIEPLSHLQEIYGPVTSLIRLKI